MLHNQRILAVVPARGGSKGIPRKNIRLLGGEPLIGYTLRTALDASIIDGLVVSTDDVEIADVASGYGVDVVRRPRELGSDSATTESVLLHVIDSLASCGKFFDIILVLEPTSPLRSVSTIHRATEMIIDNHFNSLLAIRETRENVGILKDGFFRCIVPDAPRRRQLRTPFYIESSTIYAARIDWFCRTKTLVCENWGALIVSDLEAVDINTEEDFMFAEFLIFKGREGNHD